MLEKIRLRLYNWLIGDVILSILKENEKMNQLIKQQGIGYNQVMKDLNLVKSNCNIGVDVHERSDSWAVVCVNGNKDYVNFVRLSSEDAREVRCFLKRFEKSNVTVNVPFNKDWLRWEW